MRAVRVAFRLDLPHGHVAAVPVPTALDDETLAGLHPAERAHARALPAPRSFTWAAGRLALRAALADRGLEVGPITATARGAPALPPGVLGSISHKRHLAVALVGTHGEAGGRVAAVGIDLEHDVSPRTDIGRRVLTPPEREQIAALAVEERGRATMLYFSAKEALYKALDPFVRRYVGFQEVSVVPTPDGRASVTLALAGGEGPYEADVSWLTFEGQIVTTARVTARVSP